MALFNFGRNRDVQQPGSNGIRRIAQEQSSNPQVGQQQFISSIVADVAPLHDQKKVQSSNHHADLNSNKQVPSIYGGLQFNTTPIHSVDDLMRVPFTRIVNAELQIGAHMYARCAVAKLSEVGNEYTVFVDREKATPDEVTEIVALLRNKQWTVDQGHYAPSQLILSLSQGHIQGSTLQSAREIARDPARNALYQEFMSIVGWAYDNRADDIDWRFDITSPQSQIAFKIGGKYIRPQHYLINTETMCHLLGIAWQRSGGGASAQFDPRIEQQAQVAIDLPPTDKRKNGAKIRLRWSGMSNDKGTAVTMRVQRLGESAMVKSLEQAGYLDWHMKVFRRVINSEGGLVCFSGVVGSGKSTSLAQLIGLLPRHVKIQSIEDPVELDIPDALQKTVSRDLLQTGPDPAFLSAARAIYRSALDVLYLGEVRDTETGGIARQVVESGHTVYTTTHARSALGIIDRFVSPQIGVPRDVMGAPDILKLLVFQALLPVNCEHCSKSPDEYARAYLTPPRELLAIPKEEMATKAELAPHREELASYTEAAAEHEAYWNRVQRLFGVNASRYRMVDPNGCKHCRKDGLPELNGLSGRTVVCEMVEPDEEMVRLIHAGQTLALKQYWRGQSDGRFDTPNMAGKTAMENAIYKATLGLIDPRQIEQRFSSFETIEAQREASIKASGAVLKASQVFNRANN